MHIRPLTRDEVRGIDQQAITDFGMSGLVLMENAGRGCAEKLRELGIRGKVLIACGKGNNGGDGFVIARHLDAWGYEVCVLTTCPIDDFRGDASANYSILLRSGVMIVRLIDRAGQFDRGRLMRETQSADWIVDALLGTGSTGDPRPPLADVIEILNASTARKLAVDLPSGLDCDTGIPGNPTIRADHTCTFVAPKVGFHNPAALTCLGTLQSVDIGVPKKLLADFAIG